MADAIDKAVRAQGGAVVKPHQVKAMILAARRAYSEQAKVGAAAPDSFRAVTQRDYAAVMDYFGRLAGDRPSAARPSNLIASDEQARALWSLNLEEGAQAGALGGREGARRYADALFKRIHKTDRYAATARQVWAVIFTLRNRAAGKRSKTAPGARGAAGVHLPPPAPSKRFPAFSRGN